MPQGRSPATGEAGPPGRRGGGAAAQRFDTAIAGTILVSGLTSGAYAVAMITLGVLGLGGLAAAALLRGSLTGASRTG